MHIKQRVKSLQIELYIVTGTTNQKKIKIDKVVRND